MKEAKTQYYHPAAPKPATLVIIDNVKKPYPVSLIGDMTPGSPEGMLNFHAEFRIAVLGRYYTAS